MSDRVLQAFLQSQNDEGMELASQSSILELRPAHGNPPYSYLAGFDAPTLVRLDSGEVVIRNGFLAGIYFAPEHLHLVVSAQCLGFLEPKNIWHPNIKTPFICLGKIAPGTGLCELLMRIYEVATFMRYTPREDNALNIAACQYVRRRVPFRPLTALPLKNRTHEERSIHVSR